MCFVYLANAVVLNPLRATVVLVLKGQCQFGEFNQLQNEGRWNGFKRQWVGKDGAGVKQRKPRLGYIEILHQAMEISALLSEDSTRSHSKEFWPLNKLKNFNTQNTLPSSLIWPRQNSLIRFYFVSVVIVKLGRKCKLQSDVNSLSNIWIRNEFLLQFLKNN